MASLDGTPFELPRLRVSYKFDDDTHLLSQDEEDTDHGVPEFFDVKFCPYQPLDQDAVFAAISKKHVIICRLSRNTGDKNPCSVISVIRDDDTEALNCCCTWTQDPETGNPWLCVGGIDARVKIYNVVTGEPVETLIGHGRDVNDLVTSPLDPLIIASASDDASVRIWSLHDIHKKMPCLAILAGEGHHGGLLSVDFHDTGRYIISGSHDHHINLWTLPDLPEEPIDTPIQVHYPHFSTSAVHNDIVDCVQFYGDRILSRACRDNAIILWEIEGFSSAGPPPPPSLAPVPSYIQARTVDAAASQLTRSAFMTAASPSPVPYTKLASFQTPGCGTQFFMRFKLHKVPDQNHVLGFCNAGGNIFFWDFKRLEVYSDIIKDLNDPDRDTTKPLRLPAWLKQVVPRVKPDALNRFRNAPSDKDSQISMQSGHSDKSSRENGELRGLPSQETLESWAGKYSLVDAATPLKAHKTESSNKNIVGRQTAWSPGGDWCVVVGSSNSLMVLQRWAK
ncbi:hypothetical protein NLU13_4933 [Sarocladium strictum]|uniref:Embryonic ectoderm development protein n=1 Tax=Sarocladium strictum TaxID=5046 RepID=A0AA39GJU0_SARSR|nr:hypothetical protein NLU13_4933 [Sarocladium strictum]